MFRAHKGHVTLAARRMSVSEAKQDVRRPQLNLFDAVSTGLAAILGAGIFAVIAPAAAIVGPALLVSLMIAAFVALCNALSSAQLAAVLPRTGGTYEFGRRMLGPWWGLTDQQLRDDYAKMHRLDRARIRCDEVPHR